MGVERLLSVNFETNKLTTKKSLIWDIYQSLVVGAANKFSQRRGTE